MASTARSKDRARSNAAAYSVIAIAILIAIPAVIAYAENSNDVAYLSTHYDDWDHVTLSSNSRTINDFDLIENGDHYILMVNSLPSGLTEVTELNLNFVNLPSSFFTKDRFSTIETSNESTVSMRFAHAGQYAYYDAKEESGKFVFDPTYAQAQYIKNCTDFAYKFTFNETYTSAFSVEFNVVGYEEKELFNDSTIEVMFLISGLMLIMFSLFATPWISVSQVTRTARKGARSVKNGAKKATRSVKRSVKKR